MSRMEIIGPEGACCCDDGGPDPPAIFGCCGGCEWCFEINDVVFDGVELGTIKGYIGGHVSGTYDLPPEYTPDIYCADEGCTHTGIAANFARSYCLDDECGCVVTFVPWLLCVPAGIREPGDCGPPYKQLLVIAAWLSCAPPTLEEEEGTECLSYDVCDIIAVYATGKTAGCDMVIDPDCDPLGSSEFPCDLTFPAATAGEPPGGYTSTCGPATWSIGGAVLRTVYGEYRCNFCYELAPTLTAEVECIEGPCGSLPGTYVSQDAEGGCVWVFDCGDPFGLPITIYFCMEGCFGLSLPGFPSCHVNNTFNTITLCPMRTSYEDPTEFVFQGSLLPNLGYDITIRVTVTL